jgi:hypothetical protein
VNRSSELELLQSVFIPAAVIADTQAHLRAMGRLDLEGIAVWAGTIRDSVFDVALALIPQQTGHNTGGGVCITVDGPELHRINVWLYEHRMRMIAQVHSHPTEAYHSETDDTYPIVTARGAFSIVVPDFAAEPIRLQQCAVYRLGGCREWSEFSRTQVNAMFQVSE